MVLVTAVICAAAGLLTAALALASRAGMLPEVRVPARTAGIASGALAAVAIVAFVGAGGPGVLSDKWDEFKSTDTVGTGTDRFESASGNARWQYWESSMDANDSAPLVGTGPGTFEFWWARNGTVPGFVRDAHSLYFETLSELGIIGLAILLACLGWPIVEGIRRLRRASTERRTFLAGGLAAMSAFLAGGLVDWVWELAVLPVAFLLLAAAILGSRPERSRTRGQRRVHNDFALRAAAGVIAVLAIGGIALHVAGTSEIRASQAAAATGDPAALTEALAGARTAADLQPYAATPHLQEALILEVEGEVGLAADAARVATEKEPTNWRTWLTLARLEAESGDADAALEAFRRARDLNPRSAIFTG
jgi:hypothetical protein